MNFLKNWWKGRKVEKWVEQEVTRDREPASLITSLPPLVSQVTDMEGSVWAVHRDETMVYLSGDDGLVQAQFRVEDFQKLVSLI